jgi:hypothetical protein
VGKDIRISWKDIRISWKDIRTSWKDIRTSWKDIRIPWKDIRIPWKDIRIPWKDTRTSWKDIRIPGKCGHVFPLPALPSSPAAPVLTGRRYGRDERMQTNSRRPAPPDAPS